MKLRSALSLTAVAVLAGSCGAPPPDADVCDARGASTSSNGGAAPTPEPFLAFASDFCGYHSWKHYDTTGGAALVGIHDGSAVTEYINRLPPSGSTTFPVGTIIVKEATGGTQAHELFAMVKRGGGFNPGASGWEWFDLKNQGDGAMIVWHGFGPPAGDTYGGDATAGCNTCHTDCGNDGVCAKPLALTNF
jgi:hypothetical protein